MSVVKTDVPMTSQRCEEMIRALETTYPFIEVDSLTTTVLGRPVLAMEMGEGEREVIFSAAHHANEWITATILLKFAEDLAEAAQSGGTIGGMDARELLQKTTIHLVPMVNPDGVDLVTGALPEGSREYERARTIASEYPEIPFPDGWKADLLGVDLNLQYPAGWMIAREIKFAEGFDRPAPRDYVGRAPLTQREAKALADYTEDVEPDLVAAWHTQGKVIYWQFRDYQVPGAKALGEELAKASGYELAEVPYDSSFAGYKDWFIQKFRRPGYTIEAGRGENPLPLARFPEIYGDNLPILVTAARGLSRE